MTFRYEDLRVGELILKIIDRIYTVSSVFPDSERYGLTTQMRRAANSVYLNLAEGSARGSAKDLARFLTISLGSLTEVHAALKISSRLGYIDEATRRACEIEINEVWMMLTALRASQRSRI